MATAQDWNADFQNFHEIVEFFNKVCRGGADEDATVGNTTRPTLSKLAANFLLGLQTYSSIPEALSVVGEGGFFQIVSDDENEYVILYQVQDGSAIERKRYPSYRVVDLVANAADRAEAAAEKTTTDAASALASKNVALAAAEVSGVNRFFNTKGEAEAATLIDGAIVEVFIDETRDGAVSRYRYESGALVFKFHPGAGEVTASGTMDSRRQSDWMLDLVSGLNASRLESVKRRMYNGETVKIACFGDSITAGNAGGNSYPAALLGFLREYYGNDQIDVSQLGVGGNTTQDLLDRYSQVKSYNPDLVLVMIGMNDANPNAGIDVEKYINNLSILYRQMRADGYAVLAGGITPRKRRNNNGPDVVAPYRFAQIQVADHYGIQNIDMNAILTDLVSSKNGYSWMDLSSDGIHFTNHGYRQIAGVWLCHGLAMDSLVLSPGRQKDVQVPWFSKNINADISWTLYEDNDINSKEAATMRFSNGGGDSRTLFMHIWVSDYQFCDIFFYCTEEYSSSYKPQLFVNNLSIAGSSASKFSLGQKTTDAVNSRAIGIPVRAQRLRPGHNRISVTCESGATVEVSKIAVLPAQVGMSWKHGFEFERFQSENDLPYSSSNGNAKIDYGTTPICDVGRGMLAVAPNGTRALLGVIGSDGESFGNDQNRYRLRCKIANGLKLQFVAGEWPGREYTPFITVAFNLINATTIGMAATFIGANTNTVIGTKEITVADSSQDTVISIRARQSLTDIYISDVNDPISMPFTFGSVHLVALNENASSYQYFNSMILINNGPLFNAFEGERWVDFTNKHSKAVLGGAVVTL